MASRQPVTLAEAGHRLGADRQLRPAVMSLLCWCYTGADAERAATENGTQRACSGDTVIDDELGEGIIDTLIGSDVMIEFGRGERKEMKTRPCKLVYAKEVRPAPQRAAPTGSLWWFRFIYHLRNAWRKRHATSNCAGCKRWPR